MGALTFGPKTISRMTLYIIDNSLMAPLSIMEQRTLKNVNNYLNISICSYLETSGGQSTNLYLDVVHFFNASIN